MIVYVKKLYLFSLFLFIASGIQADRAMKGIWETITLTNGTQVRAELQGDEHFHYWQLASGEKLMLSGGKYKLTSYEEITKQAIASYTNYLQKDAHSRMKAPLKKAKSHILGHKKGLIILVEFSDRSFSMENPFLYPYG